ncbi:hypothetical protein [Bifidobacterium biavatii]|uniref:Uncharacterized protein n=1 Tax=Bifidobacterium biavatii DSM 23969 TaxID=1437608 RepID=A0A086ZU60_9BIFI|nr:hypothetical protein [Bifidobacterium biavatii]KFI50060.1 hypothetical protein BBIA_2193 [Bifidobacterium biavatii DSM 23969]
MVTTPLDFAETYLLNTPVSTNVGHDDRNDHGTGHLDDSAGWYADAG